MKHNWEYKKLSEVCDRIGDGLHGTPQYLLNGGYYFVNGNNLQNGKIVISNDTKEVGQDEYDLHKNPLSDSTLLLSINGTIGAMALYRGEPVVLGKSAAYINCRDIDRSFCYYYLQLKGVVEAFYNIATGSTIKNLGLESLKKFRVPFPPIRVQKAIADHLSLFDSKIEINDRIITELEAIARLLYDYWFVQFDFPILSSQESAMGLPELKDKPYRSSGGKMVYDEVLKRNIPAGWKRCVMGEICNSIRSTVDPSSIDPEVPYVGLEHVPRRKFILDNWGVAGTVSSLKSEFLVGDVLFGKLRPYFHKVVRVEMDGICSSELLVLRAKSKIFEGLLGSIAFSDQFVKSASNQWGGAQMPRADWKRMAKFMLPVPPEELLERFNARVLPLWHLGAQYQVQNMQLRKLRDWLLPMLMNGQVKVE